jgi:uncharacterized membrane protein
MKKETAILWIWWLSLAGVIFSGILSYVELTTGTCAIGAGCIKLANIPSCVYGCAMFTAILIIATLAIARKK